METHVGRVYGLGAEKGWQEMLEEVLGEESKGEKWMKMLEKMREEGGREGGWQQEGKS